METCPSCDFQLDADAAECPRCGIVLAKYRSRAEVRGEPSAAPGSVAAAGVPAAAAPTWAPPRPAVSERTVQSLTAMRPWLNFLGIYMIVCALLVFVFAIALMVLTSPSGPVRFAPVVYAGEAVIILALAFPLKSSGNALKTLSQDNLTLPLEEFVTAQGAFWRRSGLITLIFLILIVLVVALALTGALVPSMFSS